MLESTLAKVKLLFKARAINPSLERIERTKEYKKMEKTLRICISKQIKETVNKRLFDKIENKIGKADPVIITESDEIEIHETVKEHMKPLSDFISLTTFTAFLVAIYEKTGQNFLNVNNIPGTFDLTNEQILNSIDTQVKTTFKGLDETTSSWIGDRVVEGKASGLSYTDIADEITSSVSDVSDFRANMIVRTETAKIVGSSEYETATRNGATHKTWDTVDDPCDDCLANEEAGVIGVNQPFPSGDMANPAHPNCRCLVEYDFGGFQGFVWDGQ